MRVTFETYWPLLLLLLVPGIWWMRRRTAAGLSPRHLLLSAWFRTVSIVLLTLAMAQPVIHLRGTAVSAVYLLDVSKSVSPSAIQQSMDWIRRTNGAGNPANAAFIAFAANSRSFSSLEELSHAAVSSQSRSDAINQSETDIAGAIERAMQSFAPDHIKRLVLISDGNDTRGNIATVLPQLQQQNIQVFTVPLTARSVEDAWIENVLAPKQVNAGEQFPLDVQVNSPADVAGTITIRNGSKILAQRQATLKKGANRVAFETSVSGNAGTVLLETSLQTAGDLFVENNVFRQPLIVTGKPRVLYAEGHAASAHYLKEALEGEGFSVDVIDAMALPNTVDAMAMYDAVIVSDVDAKLMQEPQMNALSTYVRDLGGGFILAGGENVYGENGYSKTIIEDLLPVTFDIRKPRQNVSMIVILDKSGSMAGDKIRFAKEAAKAPLTLLKNTDHFGMLTFNFNSSWVLRPQPVVDRAAIVNAIDEIGVGGETNLFPAMKEAFEALQKESDEIKHVIILSDGRTLTDDFAGLTKQMADAHITISTVSVGQEADRELMGKIASWGKGKTYYAEDPAGVPQIFNQDVESSAGEALQESTFKPIVTRNVEAFKGIQFQTAPRLLGYVQVKARPTSEVLLEAHQDRPLLARWQFGLGKSLMFTSDVKDRWAVDWLKWNGYAKFWSQTVRDTMRRQDGGDFEFNVERKSGIAVLTIDTFEKDGSYRDRLHMQVHVVAPDQSAWTIDAPQIAPGTYEARMPLEQHGAYTFRANSGGTDGATRLLPYSYADEYRLYPPDIEKLKAISRETHGVFQPRGPEIFAAGGMTSDVSRRPWPWLAAIALALYVLDVVLRRLPLFEQVS